MINDWCITQSFILKEEDYRMGKEENSSQFSVLSSQFSVLSFRFSVLGSQFIKAEAKAIRNIVPKSGLISILSFRI